MERAIFAMVANRDPSSKLVVEDWVREDVFIPDLTEIHVQNLYRSMDFLLEALKKISRRSIFCYCKTTINVLI